MKKIVLVLLSMAIVLSLAACGANTAANPTEPVSDNKVADVTVPASVETEAVPETTAPEELVYDIHGTFTYEKDGSTTDQNGATWICWIDSGNKFHFYGTLEHDDGTTSTVEYEGQVTNVDGYELTGHQVMFFNYTYHGEAYDPKECGASDIVSDYKAARIDDYGTQEFLFTLNRTSNDTEEGGNAGTFYAEDSWDLGEGIWDFVPNDGQIVG